MIPIVPLKYCEHDKARKRLTLASEFCGTPSELYVESHHSNRRIKFVVVGEDDLLFDQDQWDGEQQIYRPESPLPNIDHLVIYNLY